MKKNKQTKIAQRSLYFLLLTIVIRFYFDLFFFLSVFVCLFVCLFGVNIELEIGIFSLFGEKKLKFILIAYLQSTMMMIIILIMSKSCQFSLLVVVVVCLFVCLDGYLFMQASNNNNNKNKESGQFRFSFSYWTNSRIIVLRQTNKQTDRKKQTEKQISITNQSIDRSIDNKFKFRCNSR